MTPNRRQHGFTMIELVITVTLVAIVAAMAAPSMQTYVMNSRLTGASQELLRSLQTARSEATKRQQRVVVCASANPTAADPDDVVCATSGASGWIMFEDTVGTTPTNHDAGEELIDVHTVDASKLTVLSDGLVTYLPTGFADVGSGTAVVMCDSRGNVDSGGGTSGQSVARGIDITGTGRARITRNISEIDGLLGDIDDDATCP